MTITDGQQLRYSTLPDAAEWNDDHSRLKIIVDLVRPMAPLFVRALELRHYKPATPENDQIVFAVCQFAGMSYCVVNIPMSDRPRAEALLDELGLRLQNGVPHVFHNGIMTRFPLYSDSCFAIGGKKDSMMYDGPDACDQMVAVEKQRMVQLEREHARWFAQQTRIWHDGQWWDLIAPTALTVGPDKYLKSSDNRYWKAAGGGGVMMNGTLVKVRNQLGKAELAIESAMDELSLALEEADVHASNRIPGSAAAAWEAMPASYRRHIEQHIKGIDSIFVRWNSNATKADVQIDDGQEFELPRKLATLLLALTSKGRGPDTYPDPEGLRKFSSAGQLAGELGVAHHALVQLVSRLRSRMPNPMLLEIDEFDGQAWYRLRTRYNASIDTNEIQRVQDRNGSGLGAAAKTVGPISAPPPPHALEEAS